MIINQYEVEKYIHATAKRADLRVNWIDRRGPEQVPVSTNGKVINLPRITMHTTQEEAEDLIGFVAHECGHILYSDFKYLKEKGMDPEHSFLGAIANCVEDDGVDAINAEEFYGDRMIRNESHSRILTSLAEKLKGIKDKAGELPDELQAIGALIAWDCDLKGDYYSNSPLHTSKVAECLNDKGKEYLKKLSAGTYADDLRKIRRDETLGRTAKAYDVARRIYEEVYDQDADKEEKRCKQRQQEGKDGGTSEEEGKGKGKGRKAEMGKPGKEEHNEFCEFDYRPYMEDQHDEFIKATTISKGSHINYSKYKEGGGTNYTPTPFNNTIIIDYPKGTSNFSHINPMESASGHRRDYYSELDGHSSDGFANKVRMLLQIRSKGKTQYGVKKGNLHQGNIYRVVLKNAPGYNERVFKKTIHSDILDTAVMVLGDISGSMSGEKMAHQIVAFKQLNASLGNALRIPLCMLGFTEHECRNSMFIWRKFDDQQLSGERLAERMVHSSSYMHQNCDGDSIMYGYHMLKQRKEKRKVLIVLSDGSPASSKGGDIYGYTKRVIGEIEKDRHVDIIAIGIMDNNVKRLYKQHRVIQSADELEPALLSIIERKVI